MYTWEGMRILPREEAISRFYKGELLGCYYCYPDDTEAQIDEAVSFTRLMEYLDMGIQIGIEL